MPVMLCTTTTFHKFLPTKCKFEMVDVEAKSFRFDDTILKLLTDQRSIVVLLISYRKPFSSSLTKQKNPKCSETTGGAAMQHFQQERKNMTHLNYIGKIVNVRFITTRGDLAAVSQEFEKIAFLGRRAVISSAPQAGEHWQCEIIGDSKPQEAARGALFLQPLKKLENPVSVGASTPAAIRSGEFAERLDQWVAMSRNAALPEEHPKNAKLSGVKDPTRGYQFQWNGQWLTNGEVWFPRQRPCKEQWHQYPISAIPQECWQMFLEGLEGKYLEELIPFHKQILTAGRKVKLTNRQAKVVALVASHMWQGDEGCKTVSVGRNVIFVASRAGGQTVHIVDNPGVGAIYIFDDYKDARALATGSVTRTSAIKDGATRIIHIKGWQDKVAQRLAA